jgi:tetratricopeptide (TPR) repeat protein
MKDRDTVPDFESRFRRERELGAGGQGEAWLAYDERLHRKVVLKRLKVPEGSLEASRVVAERAKREARAAGALNHPGIVTVFDQFVDHMGWSWIVMEYVEGPSLRESLESGPLPLAEVAGIGAQIASALVAAHQAGVIHRDIKPANILLADDRAVVVDFGIASISDETTITAPGARIGTPQYMAPEQYSTGSTSPASDIWSLGATLYHAVEGRAPLTGEPFPPSWAPSTMHRAGVLEPLIKQLMRRNPAERPVAADVATALKSIVEDLETNGHAAIDRLLSQATEERDRGALDRAEDGFWTALDLAIQRHARRQEGWAWDGLGSCRWRADDPEMAMRFFARADRIAEETDDALLRAWCLHNLGTYRRKRGEPATAKTLFEQALTLAHAHRLAAPAGWTHHQLAEMAAEAGDAHREKEQYAAAANVGLDSGDDALAGWSLFNMARCEERARELHEAREHYAQALEIGTRSQNPWMIEQSNEGLQRSRRPR